MTVREAYYKWIEKYPKIGSMEGDRSIRWYQAYGWAEMINDETLKHAAEYFMSGFTGYDEYTEDQLIEELEIDFDDNGDEMIETLESFYFDL